MHLFFFFFLLVELFREEIRCQATQRSIALMAYDGEASYQQTSTIRDKI